MSDQLQNLFVYGTLMPGYGNHQRIIDHVHSATPATIQSILVDLGAFPALLHGEGIVRGMLLTVDAEAIRITDFIEGFHPDGGHSLYIREKIQVNLEDGTTTMAWTYFLADHDQINEQPRLHCSEIDGQSIYCWPAN